MKQLVRIPKEFDLPLVGAIMFGCIDRGTNILQVRTTTICPLNCVFCSVDSGENSRTRVADYVVEPDCIVEWLKEIVEFKGSYGIEAHLDSVGETTTYPYLVDLVQAISEIKGIEKISMQSKALFLDEEKIDELAEAGLSRINLSLDSLDTELAKKISNTPTYDVERIKGLAKYITKTKIDLILTPVWVPGLNDKEIPKIIEFAKEIGCGKTWPPLGIQNYEVHRFGRKPKGVKAVTDWKFYRRLEELEKKFNIRLKISTKDFSIQKRNMLPKVFDKGEKIRLEIRAPGWMKDEMIGVAKDRCVTVVNCNSDIGDEVRVEILENKHNLYIARKIL